MHEPITTTRKKKYRSTDKTDGGMRLAEREKNPYRKIGKHKILV